MLACLVLNSQMTSLCSFTSKVISCVNIFYILLISKIVFPASHLTWSKILICYHGLPPRLSHINGSLSLILSTSHPLLNNLSVLLPRGLRSLLCFTCPHSGSNCDYPLTPFVSLCISSHTSLYQRNIL